MTADYYVLLPTFYNSSAILIYYSSIVCYNWFFMHLTSFSLLPSRKFEMIDWYISSLQIRVHWKKAFIVYLFFFLSKFQVSIFPCFFGWRFCTFLGLPAWCYKHPKCKQTSGCFSSLDGLKFPLDWGLVIFHWCFCSPPCYDLYKTNILCKQC